MTTRLRFFYRLWLRNRRHFLTMEELSRCNDLTLGELGLIAGVSKQLGIRQ